MTDETTPQDDAAMSPASTGSVADGVIEHARKCVDFWRSMMIGARVIGMEAPSLEIGGVADLMDGLLAEIGRLRLTDAEREAIRWVCGDVADIAGPVEDTLRGLLERLG